MDFSVFSKILHNFCKITFKRPNGKQIFVGLSENYEEAKKVLVGSVITVKFLGINIYGTMQFPKFYRERIDVNWEDLINS